MNAWLFYPLAALVVASALGVVVTPNPVRSALSLVVTLFLLSVCYVTLDAHLVAALQIIVYAGAVMVLFLFVITLLNLQTDPDDTVNPLLTAGALASAATVAVGLGVALMGSETAKLTAVLPEGFGTTAVLARSLFTEHIIAFELTSVMLLVAVVGSVVLAKLDRPAAMIEADDLAQAQAAAVEAEPAASTGGHH